MQAITTVDEIERNLRTLEDYLSSDDIEHSSFAKKIIKKGVCFIAYSANGEMRFAPSRYSGYLKNSKSLHLLNDTRHGSETNSAIRKCLGLEKNNSKLEKDYLRYCESLGFSANKTGAFGHPRKYWKLKLSVIDFPENIVFHDEFPEGRLVERIHNQRERNPQIVKLKKEIFLKEFGTLHCEICRFNFEEKYGLVGRDFIEVHHLIAVSDMKIGHKTKLDDLILVCSNCHRMIHRKRPWPEKHQLGEIIQIAS